MSIAYLLLIYPIKTIYYLMFIKMISIILFGMLICFCKYLKTKIIKHHPLLPISYSHQV
jgi:hypothetical protein